MNIGYISLLYTSAASGSYFPYTVEPLQRYSGRIVVPRNFAEIWRGSSDLRLEFSRHNPANVSRIWAASGNLFPSFHLSLFPSFFLSLFPVFSLSLFPSFSLSLFPLFSLFLCLALASFCSGFVSLGLAFFLILSIITKCITRDS